ncbi:SPOR domain-containing protein [Flectobacillus sp. DC10W]|uniref:SPOR domain-containing protein n=1 Tax=Flectobacillus longus TaxID=2984207 RepID=A0ABT6YIB3_9BACT|nr:SPOR domain-containing protein [Flectobacillus longus]MDI9863139.1 SPOR domain-containing protein [Flectobacillus longus]
MATIQHYIQELLFERDCVVVPDFGGFITNFQSAKLDRSLNYISPAKRWVAFNSLLKNDDGLLSHFIAKSEGVSLEESTIKIRAFVDALKFRLRNAEQVYLENIGFFELNKENKLVFTPLSNQNYCSDSFGLSAVNIYPSKRNQDIELPQVEAKSKLSVFRGADRAAERVAKTSKRTAATVKKLVPFMTGVATAVLLGIGILSYEEQNSLSTMNPFVGITTRKSVPAPIIETKSKFDTLSSEIKPSQDSVTTSQGNNLTYTNNDDYFVIVGSFGNEANAQKFVKELQSKGFSNATVIEPERKGRLIKVSANSYHNENQAYTESAAIKSKLRASAWIFKSSKK